MWPQITSGVCDSRLEKQMLSYYSRPYLELFLDKWTSGQAWIEPWSLQSFLEREGGRKLAAAVGNPSRSPRITKEQSAQLQGSVLKVVSFGMENIAYVQSGKPLLEDYTLPGASPQCEHLPD